MLCRLALPPVKMFFNKPAWSSSKVQQEPEKKQGEI